MKEISIYHPGKVTFGVGCIKQLVADVLSAGVQRICIITIPEILESISMVLDQLKNNGISYEVVTDLKGEPTYTDFHRYTEKAIGFDADCIAGIGGGSVMDLAKIVAAMLHSTQQLSDVVGIRLLKGRSIKLICAPTTSGTGSEMSPNSILLDEDDNSKKGIISPYLVPDLVYIDPELTIKLPANVTAYTGFDALTHCIEAYCNKNAHPMIDVYALEGIRLIGRSIFIAVNYGIDIESRTNLALGSMYGGMCLGPVNTAAVHAMAYPLGSDYHIPHGLSNALLLPFVMNFNLDADYNRFADVALALGAERGFDNKETSYNGVIYLHQMLKKCGINTSLKQHGVKEPDFEKMAVAAVNVKRLMVNNLKEISFEDAISIYKSAY